MQETVKKIQLDSQSKVDTLPQGEMQTVVAAFSWLIEEDKKQNPSLYNI